MAYFENALNAYGATIVVDERRRLPIPERAPEAVKDLVFDAVAEALTQLTGRRTPCYETVTAGTLWSLVRQPTTGRDDPERTLWTS